MGQAEDSNNLMPSGSQRLCRGLAGGACGHNVIEKHHLG
jgi:hypothetical protein